MSDCSLWPYPSASGLCLLGIFQRLRFIHVLGIATLNPTYRADASVWASPSNYWVSAFSTARCMCNDKHEKYTFQAIH